VVQLQAKCDPVLWAIAAGQAVATVLTGKEIFRAKGA
jgi:hypothetical protein